MKPCWQSEVITASVCEFVTGDLPGFCGLVNISDEHLVTDASVGAHQ